MLLAALVEPMPSVPKLRLVGDTVTWTTPLPDRLTVCGLLLASSLTVKAALRAPAAAGVNVTLMVQAALAATLDPQLLL